MQLLPKITNQCLSEVRIRYLQFRTVFYKKINVQIYRNENLYNFKSRYRMFRTATNNIICTGALRVSISSEVRAVDGTHQYMYYYAFILTKTLMQNIDF